MSFHQHHPYNLHLPRSTILIYALLYEGSCLLSQWYLSLHKCMFICMCVHFIRTVTFLQAGSCVWLNTRRQKNWSGRFLCKYLHNERIKNHSAAQLFFLSVSFEPEWISLVRHNQSILLNTMYDRVGFLIIKYRKPCTLCEQGVRNNMAIYCPTLY